MTNREKLIKTNIYDLLSDINKGLTRRKAGCVIEALDKEKNCYKCDFGNSCAVCIAEWLGKEERK